MISRREFSSMIVPWLAPGLSAAGCASLVGWQRVTIAGGALEYRSVGDGEPMVFVHAGVFGDWFDPLLREPALGRGLRLVTYHRAGYAGSDRLAGVASIAQHAAQLRALLDRLRIERAHLVGHSSGALIAIQLALDAPRRVRSLALLEPALTLPGPTAPSHPSIAAALELYRAGDRAGAVDAFMRAVAGPDYRAALDAAIPRAFPHAVADAETFFALELPAVRAWRFDAQNARRIAVPVLAVIGEHSPAVGAIWQQRQDWLLASLPQAEPFVLPRATHLLHLQNSRGMAERLAAFVAGQSARE